MAPHQPDESLPQVKDASDHERLLQKLTVELRAMRLGDDPEQVMAEALEHARHTLRARAIVLLFFDIDSEQVYRWDVLGDDVPVLRSEVPPIEVTRWITPGRTELSETLGAETALAQALGAQTVLSVRIPRGPNCGRLLVVDAGVEGCSTALRNFAHEMGPLLERVHQLTEVRRQAIEEERNRIVQDFHDGPLQTFLALHVQLQFIRRLLDMDRKRAAKELEQLQSTVRQQGRELRDILQEMRPIDLDRMGLIGLLRQLAEDLQKSGDLEVRFHAGGKGPEPSRRVSREIYQIVREAITNARKHGHASHIVISIESCPDSMTILVDDDGQGFPFTGKYTLEQLDQLRLGPVTIKQRAHQIGAHLELESTGHGARLRLKVRIAAGTSRAAEQ